MPKIKRLPPHEAQKIAAGQVIERPANAVKELVENSIDAGASFITIFIEDGGKRLIRVVDNGQGMDREDAQLCLEKHATSKISTLDDLMTINSYGFRGEALASIAAVGTVTMLTKESQNLEGTKITAHDGLITSEPIACPEGTDITVTHLFHTMPARAKFLKKTEVETRHILHLVHAICLAHPTYHVQLFVDGEPLLNCPSQTTIMQRCCQLWGTQVAPHIVPLETEESARAITVTGAISDHAWFRYDRKTIFFLVNKRWVTNHHLARALIKGYDNVIPHGRYPTACISITIDPDQIDVNTHPKKEEIVFAHPHSVEKLIYTSVRTTLEQSVSKQLNREVFFMPSIPSAPKEPSIHPFTPPLFAERDPFSSVDPQIPSTLTHQEQQKALPIHPMSSAPYTLIGQLHKTYLLIEQEEGLYLVDQHAAHERILYEQFTHRFHEVPTITLMFPSFIPCNADDRELLEKQIHLFHEHGIAIEPFGREQLIVHATPVHLKDVPLPDLINQVVGWIREYNDVDRETFAREVQYKLRAQMACKAAIKAGDPLSFKQMQELLGDLYACPQRFSCPHGRPTGWLYPLPDIEKKFRRR